MKCIIALALFGVLAVNALPKIRNKREAYQLPDGAELLLGGYSTNFVCQQDGYYADVDNNCQIFHVCNTIHREEGPEVQQFSFLCGNQTIFNQLSFTCAGQEDAIPCASSPDFFNLNDNIGREDALFLQDQDVLRGEQLKASAGPGANRVAPVAPRRNPQPSNRRG